MNVLFIGKWDIAGAYISDRLFREGHEVCWMTEEKTGTLWNKKFRGNIYRGVWRREDYLRILKANSVDTVFFLTGEFRENYEELPEYESQMMELTNLLNAIRNYPLKCMVYLSSLELDYDSVHTPTLTDLAAGEMLCEAYHKAYGLPVLILRFGCVYGSFGFDHMGFTGRILKKFQKGNRVESLYSASDELDVIYGDDLAMAVYGLWKMEKQGLYRIFTGYPVTMEEYYQGIGKAAGCIPQVVWLNRKHTASRDYFVSDKTVKLETGWIPFYLWKEKGIAVLQKGWNHRKQNENSRDSGKVFWGKVFRVLKKTVLGSALETLILFAGTCFLLRFEQDVSDLKYVDIRLMFVSVVSCLYGVKMGVMAIVLASLSYIYSLLSANVDVSYLLYSVDTWIPFVVYTIAGAVIGYSVDRRQDDMDALLEKYSLLTDKYEFVKSVQGETLEIKGQLQRQIMTSRHSFGKAYDIAVELDSLKPEQILLKVTGILEDIMECKGAAIFLINGSHTQFARLKACSQSLRDQLPASLNMEDYDRIYPAFRENGIFMNQELLPDYPDYAAPIYYQEKLYGFVALFDIGVDKFTVYYQNLFKIVTSLIEKNLIKALAYEESQKEKLYYPNTELLYPKAFEERLAIMKMENGNTAHSFVQAKVYPEQKMEKNDVSDRIFSVIRGNDCMGIDRDGDYAVILVNMSMEHLDQLKERFHRKGLKLEAVYQ